VREPADGDGVRSWRARGEVAPPRRQRADLTTADRWGIEAGFEDALGVWRETDPAIRRAIREVMGASPGAAAPSPGPRVRVLRRGESVRLARPSELRLEDGTTLSVSKVTPPDLPLGYHRLIRLDGATQMHVIVAPPRCHLPADLRAWGWAVQLYGLRSAASWGMGDLGDLRRVAQWSAGALGAGILLVNPLWAAATGVPQEPSPYFPSSRRYRNLLYLRVEEVPGAAQRGIDLDRLAAAGRAMSREARIDRDAVYRLKMDALERLFSQFAGDATLDRYCAAEGPALQEFATFCALAERQGRRWRSWPLPFRHPRAAGIARFATEHARRIRFHQWIQWLLDEQLARAAGELRLIQDLPIGIDPEGADAWAWQDLLALDATVGAPPDEFNTLGQDWGLPPFIPHRLRAEGYAPLIQTLRASLRHAGGLRIDHVMGLFRLFWIPAGRDPSQGAFVRYAARELLAVVAIESQRAGAVIVGEDLGTVERGVRRELVRHGILSCRLMWFEPARPARYPVRSLAAVTTHDLPTIVGLWSGRDLETQRALGLRPNEAGTRAILDRLQAMAGLAPSADPAEVILRIHELLAGAPSMLITATLEDALAVAERPNLPGATAPAHPNWCRTLPKSIEEIERDPLPRAIGRMLARPAIAHPRRDPPDPPRRRRQRARRARGGAAPSP
jgi:4-alpha-glucanotransferase